MVFTGIDDIVIRFTHNTHICIIYHSKRYYKDILFHLNTCVNLMEVSYIPMAKARGFMTHWITANFSAYSFSSPVPYFAFSCPPCSSIEYYGVARAYTQ